ncbi:MAG: copper transporter [Limnochordia bacterium]
MVVDIRYHLASLVAVFFALGVGILVGTTLSAAETGQEVREQWLAAIERELEALRGERQQARAEVERVAKERDFYRDFAEELVAWAVQGRLPGQEVAVAVLGPDPEAAARLEAALERAGAAVVRRPPQPGDAPAGPAGGGSGDEGAAPVPLRVVAVLDGPAETYRKSLEALIDESAARGGKVTAAARGGEWAPVLDELGLSYVTGWDSPPGLLSLILLLASGEAGRYRWEDEGSWPRHLLLAPAAGEAGGGGP